MNRERALTVVCAVCCCFALVSLSSALDASVSGSPEDEFDVGPGSLPVSSEDTGELKEAYRSAQGEGGQPADSSGESGDAALSGAANGEDDGDPGDGEPPDDGSSSGASSGSSSSSQARAGQAEESGGGGESQSQSGQGTGTGTTAQEDGWLALLRQLLRAALLLGSAGVVLGTAWAASRYRERLLAWLRSLFDRSDSKPGEPGDAAADHPFDPPDGPVERAWLDMVRLADVDPDPGATPREATERLVRAGFDQDAVRELTDLFERVRYGGADPSAEQVQRAHECLRASEALDDGGDRP